jgi:hypothetical protein
MNKTIIALAIAAALPVAAQADITLSGSDTNAYKNTGVIDTDAALKVSVSEVLANGMTATATLNALSTESQDASTATLTGDFGSLTAGSMLNDSAFQSGDVADVVGLSDDADDGGNTISGIKFTTSQAGLSLAAQLNAATGPDALVAETKSTQLGATYDFNGLTVGYAYASDDVDASSTVTAGVNAAQSAFGAAYTFGDLVVTAGKSSIADNAVVSATYTMVADALTVKVQADNFHSATDTNDYQIDLSYAMTDALTLSSEIDKGATTTMVAAYTAGELTASVSKTDDGTTDASVALTFGNAVLTLARNGGDEDTTATYAVAF